MSREILFKAKRKNWRELPKKEQWVEGNLITDEVDADVAYIGYVLGSENGVIHDIDVAQIAPETLCQYTGLTDKNGKRIWENDIANIRNSVLAGYGLICYENGCLVIKDRRRKRTYDMFGEWKIRVDGNIFDNPELLE